MNQFEEIECCYIDSLRLDFQLFVDARTGARHVHLANDDTNNAFMVVFPTRPSDSTGVAHILEHTTLCGSESFPVRDPFFMMLRRSLNTFMNAFTSSDCTAYPFATQNRQDFENLLRVYLDAVFFPLLDPLDFDQEGWRLDFTRDETALAYKGVVYNEMKGAMSSPIAQLWQHLSSSLFPDTIYAHNSGGDPLAITDLKYINLKEFHRHYYHPSHAVFMTYGDFPAADHQRVISEQALSRFSRTEPHPELAKQKSFSTPVATRLPYEIDSESTPQRKTHVLWGWVLGDTASPKEALEAQLLAATLLDNSASPLRYLLETTDLADAPAELCGVDDSAQQLVLMAGVEGSDEENIAALDQQITQVFEEVVARGIDKEVVDGIIDGIEMSQRDVGGDSYPYGLQLMSRILPAFIYGAEPKKLLSLDEHIEALRAKVKDKRYIPNLVRRHLIDNPHRARIVLWPDRDKAAREQEFEKNKLRALHGQLSADAKRELKERLLALETRQASEEDVTVLPTVTLADVPLDIVEVTGEKREISGTELNLYDRATNGLFYANLVFDLSPLSDSELELLPFFTEFLLELGNGDEEYTDVQKKRARIGTFSAYASARNGVANVDAVAGRLVITSKCLARKSAEAIAELAEILPAVRVDEIARIKDLVTQERADAEASIVERGHEIALLAAASGLTPSATLDDWWQGPINILRTQSLENEIKHTQSLNELINSFEHIRQKLLAQKARVLYVGETEVLKEVSELTPGLSFDRGGHRHENASPGLANLPAARKSSAWLTSSQVNFCARAHRAVPPGDDAVAGLLVASKYLQDGYLHPAIREVGGAYGSGAQYDAESSTFRFFSYRDPRLTETFDDFSRSLDWLAENNRPDRLQESILGVIRQLDKPKTPAGAAISAFYDQLDGVGHEFRRTLRQRVLDTSYADVLAAVQTYLLSEPALSVVGDRSKQMEIEAMGLSAEKLT